MPLGVHLSVRHGFAQSLRDAARLGCDTLQIFTKSPRDWRTRVYADAEFAEFRAVREELGIGPVVVHTPYLPNLCTSLAPLYERSLRALKEDLARCEQLGAEYLVIHPGAWSPDEDAERGLRRLLGALNEALAGPGRTAVLIENMAGGGRRLGGPFEELALMLNGVRRSARIGVCFDTCHAFGAGYDLSTEKGVDGALNAFDRAVGLSAIKAFHVNDSRAPAGSHRDMHEHLGRGGIGEAGFRRLFAGGRFGDRPLILETPKDSARADLTNLSALRGWLREAGEQGRAR